MEDRKNTQFIIGLFIFGIIAMALSGIDTVIIKDYQTLNEQCELRSPDFDNDGKDDFISDEECWAYPYEDGNGESETRITDFTSGQVGSAQYYQPYFDLTVDFVRTFVLFECNNNLNNCIGTNFQNEVQFYCFFSDNVMNLPFGDIFHAYFNHPYTPASDGSEDAFLNTCMSLSGSPTKLPLIEFQATQTIAENPGGNPPGQGFPR